MKIFAPINGKVKKLEEINDEVISQGMLGEGLGIVSDENIQEVCSPISGIVTSIFPTNHAFLVYNDNHGIMIHIGVDTIELEGKCFERLIEEGSNVLAGQPIIRTNFQMINEKGLDSCVLTLSPEEKINNLLDEEIVEVNKSVIFEI